VLTNLVGNAIEFTPSDEGYIRVTASRSPGDDSWICIAVEDNGIGIDPATITYVPVQFDPAPLVLAFVLGAGLASVPALGSGQGKGKIPELPPQAMGAAVDSDAVALVRVLEKNNTVYTYANSTDTFRDENPPVVFDISEDPPKDTIEVSASVPIDYLLQFDQSTDPVEVIGVSVLLRAGSGTCRCRRPCLRRSMPRSVARPGSTCPKARTWSARSTSRGWC
jgi:hypothetical protein